MRSIRKISTEARRKYANLSVPLKSSFWFMVCVFVQRGISMITTPVFTRIMPQEEYGMTSTFASWQSVLEIFMSLELAACGMVLFARHDERKKEIASVLSSLEVVVTSIWMVIFLLFMDKVSQILQMPKVLCICMVFTVMSTQVIQIWMGYKRYVYDYRGSIGVTLFISTFTSVFGVVGVLFVSPAAESRLVPYTVVNFLVGVVLYISLLKQGRVFYNKEIWKFAFSYGIPVLPHYISQFILSSSDRLMISYMCGQKDVALYSVAYSVGSLIGMFTYAVNASFAPYQFQHIRSKEYKSLAKTANIVLLFVAVLLTGIMLFSREIIWIFAGDAYLESTRNVIPICLGIYFNYVFQLFARVEEFYLHKMMIAIASTFCAILNLALNYIFITLYGYEAASYTTFVCYLVFCLLHYAFYRRVLRIEENGARIYDMKGILIICLMVVAAGVLLFLIQNLLWMKYTIAGIIVVIVIVKRNTIMDELRKNH